MSETSEMSQDGQLSAAVSLLDVQAAARRIRPFVQRTPLEHSARLSHMSGAEVWLKLECFQLTGSFKLRGALNALLSLDEAARTRGEDEHDQRHRDNGGAGGEHREPDRDL